MPIFQFRRGTPAQARDANRVLANGEPGVDRTSTGGPPRMKIGDGVTAWNALPWLADGVSVRTIPGVYTSLADNQPAIQAAIDAAPYGAVLVLPPGGPFLIQNTIALGDRKRLVGGNQQFGTYLQAGVAGLPVMMTMASNSVVEDVCLNGAGLAQWGLMVPTQSNKVHQQRVRVEQCTQAGFVYEGTQNSLSLDCIAASNGVNYLLANGTANHKFINCNGGLATGADANARGILITNSTDPRFTGTVYAGGNRAISFFGGIHERGSAAHPQVEITDLTGYASFTETELTSSSPVVIKVGSNVTGRVVLNGASIALSSTSVAVSAAGGNIHADHCWYGGQGGYAETQFYDIGGTASFTVAADSSDVFPNILGTNGMFRYGIGGWVASGTGGASWDSTGWRLNVASNGPATGARCSYAFQTGAITAGRLARISFYVSDITGAAAVTVRSTTASTTKAINLAGTYGPGEHSIITPLDGDETGIQFGAASAVASTFKVAYVTVNLI